VAASSITRVAIYGRVSTLNHGQDVSLQTRDLREYCERRGWTVIGEYVEVGVSGMKERRPELDRLLAAAYSGRFDAVLVWKLDRFGRSLRHLVNTIAELEARGISFVSLRDNLDLSTPSGRLMFQIIGAMAEFERALIAERVKAGMKNARAKGRRIGRPSRVPLTEEIRGRIVSAHENGEGSLRNIAARFGTSLGTVQRCLAMYQKVRSQAPVSS